MSSAPPVVARASYAGRLESVTKVYGRGESAVRALDAVSVAVPPATFIAVMGPSGPVPSLPVRHNVALPQRLAGERVKGRWLADVLDRVGLDGRRGRGRTSSRVAKQQRVAIARRSRHTSDVVFPDEPTGALDTVTTGRCSCCSIRACNDNGQTVIMVMDNPVAASYADTVLFLADGRIAGDMDRPATDRVAERLTHLAARA